MILPSKLQSGQNFKRSTVQAVNEIIDYLKTQRISGDNKTIRVDQQTAGITLHALPQNGVSVGGGSSTEFDHPFKMKIVMNEELSANVLTIQAGAIFLTGDDTARISVKYEQNSYGAAEYVELPEQAGTYVVNLAVMYDLQSQDPANYEWEKRVFFTPSSTHTDDYVNSCGYHTFSLGLISVEEVSGQFKYSILKQYICSDFSMYDGKITQPFKARFKVDNYIDDGEVLQTGQFPDKLVLNAGDIYYENQQYHVDQRQFQITSGTVEDDVVYCASLYILSGAANFTKIETNHYQYFDQRNQMYNIPIASIIGAYSENSLVGIQQYIDTNFSIGGGSKVCLNEDDQKSDYLDRKHVFPTILSSQLSESQREIYLSSMQYIKGITIDRNADVESGIIDYFDEIYWDYSAISGWNKEVNQQIYSISGKLKWDDAGKIAVSSGDQLDFIRKKLISTSGSILFDELSGKKVDINVNPDYFRNTDSTMAIELSGDFIDIKSLGKVRVNSSDTRINYLNAKIKSDDSSIYVIPSAYHIDLRSTGKLRVNSDDTLGYLQSKVSSDDSSIQVIPSAHHIDFRSTGKVRVNANDNLGYLQSKIHSDDSSIQVIPSAHHIDLRATGMIRVNADDDLGYLPSKLNSTDSSIEILPSAHFVDLKSTGKVKCSAADTPDYLNSKIFVDGSIAALILLQKTGTRINIKSALSGTGIMFVNNGSISLLSVPAGGNYVLGTTSGAIGWIPYADCDNACEEE